jgi:exodeoxyribonuclease VIII
MKHAMVDLETLGTTVDSVFLSVAAIQFDFNTGEKGDIFNMNIKLDDALKHGRKVQADTVHWWLTQQPATMQKMFERSQPLACVLGALKNFIESNGIVYTWGNPASFDLGMLIHAYNQLGIEAPWKYYNERCYRTMKSLFELPMERLDVGNSEAHNPMADCNYQIDNLCAIWGTLKKRDG